MSDASPQKRPSETQEEAPEAKIAKLKADVKAAEEVAVNGKDAPDADGDQKEGEPGKNGTTVAEAVDQVLNGELQAEDDEDEEEDEDYDDEEEDEEHGEGGEFNEDEEDDEDEDEDDDEEEDEDEDGYSGAENEASQGNGEAADGDES